MRKLIKYMLGFVVVICLSGCNFLKKDMMENIDIYTTIYPINYLIKYLYGDNANVYSIYPNGVNIDDYKLSEKKLNEYSRSDLFVFNSLDNERDYAVEMINRNHQLKMIDVGMGMNYEDGVEQLWLNPYNYLMMAKNVKNGLAEYITNPYLTQSIDTNFEKLQYELSSLDASFKEMVKYSAYDTIVVDNDVFKFLEKYDLNIISLEDNDSLTTPTINEVKKLLESGKVKYIYSSSSSSNDTVNELIKDYGAELVTINTMRSIDGGVTNSNESYLTVMNNNIDLFKRELYK